MIIKEIDPPTEIVALKSLLKDTSLPEKQRKKLMEELYKLEKGREGERRAAYYIKESFDPSKWFIVNDLRLRLGDRTAQIDHMAVNSIGMVWLFESKSFSNEIRVDDRWVFYYLDRFSGKYRSFPSPLEQSKRHEGVVKEALLSVGINPVYFEHVVLFDFGTVVHKPNKPEFDRICYPDQLRNNKTKILDNIKNIHLVNPLINIIYNRLFSKADQEFYKNALQKLVEKYHHPITFEECINKFLRESPKEASRAKSINWDNVSTEDYVEVDVSSDIKESSSFRGSQKIVNIEDVKKRKMLTISKLAAYLKIPPQRAYDILMHKGVIEKNYSGMWVPTRKGMRLGAKLIKGKSGGYFILLPKNIVDQVESPWK